VAVQFDNFSPQSFERLAQAICVHVFGPGTIVFGSGADGAREAVFEGRIPFPGPAAKQWDGYIVVQAKCREQLRHTGDDASWLCQQLASDLDKFVKKERPLRKPQYFLLISNVKLSSVAEKGGKAKVESVFKNYEKSVGLKGYAVWSQDELRTLLDGAEDIRRAYTNWLTPSDVLADLVDTLKRPDLKKLLPLVLARDLRNERDVRLKDAGHETDKAIFLEHVFVDLPVVKSPQGEHSQPPGIGQSQNVVALILKRASDKLDSETMEATRQRDQPLRNRIVVLGGPGQGKSTIGQFLVQFERARLLSTHQASSMNPQTVDLIQPIIDRAKEESLGVDRPVRFPLRINLPDFADALENERPGDAARSLIAFIALKLSKGLDAQISADDLRQWLGSCASLIVLDGLDEVPPTANRRNVVTAIDALWDDLNLIKADTLVIVTTRPQGYNRDLDPQYWEHMDLAPLEARYAKRFASRLAELRVSDVSERVELVRQIELAANDESTKALVTSPLQVAIMFGIILLKGAVPKDRWELFDRYYTLLRDREAQKPGSIVREFKRQIDVLHQQVGFLLHVRSEGAGKSVSFILPEEFNLIIRRLLIEEGYEESDAVRISAEIERTATDRLVFLTARVSNQIAFDVRSLQEFMAAGQITAASSVNLVERLRAISTSPHWRNVFRIVASKIFSVADFGNYRDDVVGICHGLDSGDLGEEFRLTRAGAALALELLGDGLAVNAPKYRKSLLRRGIAVLDVSPTSISQSLLGQLSDENKELISDELKVRLLQGNTIAEEGAFKFLFAALHMETKWAEERILKHWPNDPSRALRIFANADLAPSTPHICERLRADQWNAGPAAAQEFALAVERVVPTDSALKLSVIPHGYLDETRDVGNEAFEVVVVPPAGGPRGNGFRTVVTPVKRENLVFSLSAPPTRDWLGLFAIASFGQDPSKPSLGSVFKIITESPKADLNKLLLPWIVEIGLKLLEEGMSCGELMTNIQNGKLGDIEDWILAEKRWRLFGIEPSDLLAMNEPFFNAERIGSSGAPVISYLSITSSTPLENRRLRGLLTAIDKVMPPLRKYDLIKAALFVAHNTEAYSPSDLSAVFKSALTLLRILPERERIEVLIHIIETGVAPYENLEFIKELDSFGLAFGVFHSRRIFLEKMTDSLLVAFKNAKHLRGLLVIIARMALAAESNESVAIEPQLLESLNGDSKAVQVAISVLKILFDRWQTHEISSIVGSLVEEELSDSDFERVLASVEEQPRSMELIIAFAKHAGDFSIRKSAIFAATTKRVADRESSPLATEDRRKALALPSFP
jgi:hypothetical protein